MILILDIGNKCVEGACCICSAYWKCNVKGDDDKIYCPSCAMKEVIQKRAKFESFVNKTTLTKTNNLVEEPILDAISIFGRNKRPKEQRVKVVKEKNSVTPLTQLDLFG